MHQRVRKRVRTGPGGSIKTTMFGVPQTPQIIPGRPNKTSTTIDFVGKKYRGTGSDPLDILQGIVPGYPPTDFSSDTTWFRVATINGTHNPISTIKNVWTNVYPGRYGTAPAHIPPVKAFLSDEEYGLKLLAETNPFRSGFSLPVFTIELVELSSLFKLALRNYATLAGGSYLNVQFGWLNFLNDLLKFGEITKMIEARMKEFKSFYGHGGLRRKHYLDSSYGTTGMRVGGIVTDIKSPAYDSITTSYRVWGACHWLPTLDALEIPTSEALTSFNNALAQVLDLEAPDPETVWELMPFSWLVDYFHDFGSFLAAHAGKGYATPKDICIMRETETILRCAPIENWGPGFSWTGGTLKRLTKYRKVLPDGVPSSIPMSFNLTDNQVSTVTALISLIIGSRMPRILPSFKGLGT